MNLPLENSVLVKDLDSEFSKIQLKSTTKITKYHDSTCSLQKNWF